jgi:hypothetical protein
MPQKKNSRRPEAVGIAVTGNFAPVCRDDAVVL